MEQQNDQMNKRNTMQKKMVLEAVFSMKNHPTAEEVYSYVAGKYPEISRATVYRNLKVLSEFGHLKKIPVPGAADRFDFNVLPHYHIKCTICGRFDDLDIPYITDLDEIVRSLTQYDMENHDIVFRGICPSCRIKI